MTVSTITIKNSYSGNGSATAFAYTFKIFASAELKVYIRTEADGTETLKTVTTHYTVSGIGDTGGGTVTFTAGNVPTSAQQVLLTRDSPLTQSTDYVENDPFPASSHEDALDKLTHQMQEQQEELDRSFKVSKTVTDLTSSEVVDDAATRASKILGFSTNGASFAYYDNASTDVEVSSIAGLTSAANKMIRYTGSGTADLIDFLDQDDMSGNSASAVPSQQSVVAYVAAQITAEDLDVTSDSGTIAIDLNSETLTVAGGTGLASAATSNTVTLNIDSTVATLAGTQTLTNKTLTSPKINDTTAITSTGAELNILDGVTSTAAELNILDGVTSTAAELNILDGVTSTAAELNILDGVTSTTAELNILDGVTATATELNLIDGVTATTAELNILDGVTSTAAELNILDGVTSTAAELNILDGATVVVGEINALDIGATAIGTAVASKAIILDANKDYTGVRNFTISGELDAATLDISGAIDVAGNSVLASVDVTGLATAATFEPDGDTAAGDNAAMGYTSVLGAILTGQGSTNDVTLVNDADATVLGIPTGTTNVAITGDLTANNFAGRNKIINGAMVIDQRNAGVSVTLTNGVSYILDRYRTVAIGTSLGFSSVRSATAPAGFSQSYLATVTSAKSVAATDQTRIDQFIEGYNVADLNFGTANAKTITLSFWVRSSVTGTYCVHLGNSSSPSRSYVAEYAISSANTFEYKTITISGDTTGTWTIVNGVGFGVSFVLGMGSNFTGSAGWQAGEKFQTSNQTQWIGTGGATFYVTGVQLEAGSVATTFDARSVGTELALCQRYYQQQFTFNGYASNTTTIQASAPCIISMRATPTLSAGGVLTVTDGASNYAQSSLSITGVTGTPNGISFNAPNFSSLTQFRPCMNNGTASSVGSLAYSAEL